MNFDPAILDEPSSDDDDLPWQEPGAHDRLEEPADQDDGEVSAERVPEIVGHVEPESSAPSDNPLHHVWTVSRHMVWEHYDDRHRPTRKPQLREHCRFDGRLPGRASSRLIWRNELFLVHESRDFSWPMRYFAHKFLRAKVCQRTPMLEGILSAIEVLQTCPPPSDSPDDLQHFDHAGGRTRFFRAIGSAPKRDQY
jgi:hypothetical protein